METYGSRKNLTAVLLVGALGIGLMGSACGNEQSNADKDTPGADDGSGAGASAGGGGNTEAAPRYVVAATVATPEGQSLYVSVLGSLEKGTDIDLSRALEIPAGGGIMGPPGEDWFLLGRGDEPTLTRYDVDEDGAMKEAGKLSLQGFGVANTWAAPEYAAFLSPTRAFFLSYLTSQVFELDPTQMTVTKEIALDELTAEAVGAPEGYVFYIYGMTRRDDYLYVYGMVESEDNAMHPFSRVAVVHMPTGDVSYADDDRCGGIFRLSEGPDGALYASTLLDWFNLVERPSTPAGCILRLPRDKRTFDEAFYVPTSSLVADGLATGVLFDGAGKGWTRFLDASDVPADLSAGTSVFWGVTSWGWAELSDDLSTAAPLEGAPESGFGWTTYSVGADVLFPVSSQATPESPFVTTLYRFAEDGPVEMLSYDGYPWGILALGE
jgi:hypothetical protein